MTAPTGVDLRQLIADLADPDPCEIDHVGDCRAHGWAPPDGQSCPHGRAHRYLAAPVPAAAGGGGGGDYGPAALSRLLFAAREHLSMWADVVTARSDRTAAAPIRRTIAHLDAYRGHRGWNPNGFGGEQ